MLNDQELKEEIIKNTNYEDTRLDRFLKWLIFIPTVVEIFLVIYGITGSLVLLFVNGSIPAGEEMTFIEITIMDSIYLSMVLILPIMLLGVIVGKYLIAKDRLKMIKQINLTGTFVPRPMSKFTGVTMLYIIAVFVLIFTLSAMNLISQLVLGIVFLFLIILPVFYFLLKFFSSFFKDKSDKK